MRAIGGWDPQTGRGTCAFMSGEGRLKNGKGLFLGIVIALASFRRAYQKFLQRPRCLFLGFSVQWPNYIRHDCRYEWSLRAKTKLDDDKHERNLMTQRQGRSEWDFVRCYVRRSLISVVVPADIYFASYPC